MQKVLGATVFQCPFVPTELVNIVLFYKKGSVIPKTAGHCGGFLANVAQTGVHLLVRRQMNTQCTQLFFNI